MLLAPFHRLLRRLAYALADVAADAVYALWAPGRHRIRENLRAVLGTDDGATLDYWGQRQLRRYGEYCLEALWPAGPTPAGCDAALDADPADWERVRALAAQGPLIFALLHQGNWDVAGGAFTHNVGPSTVLVESLGARWLDAVVQGRRERLGMRVVYETAPRAALRTLRSGGALGLLFDRPLGDGGAGRRCDVLRRALPAAGGAGAAGPGDGRPRRADGGAANRQPGDALPGGDRARLRPTAQRRPRGRRANAHAVAAGLVRGAGATASRPVVHVPPLLLAGLSSLLD